MKILSTSSAQKEKIPGVAGSAMQQVLVSPTHTTIPFHRQFSKW